MSVVFFLQPLHATHHSALQRHTTARHYSHSYQLRNYCMLLRQAIDFKRENTLFLPTVTFQNLLLGDRYVKYYIDNTCIMLYFMYVLLLYIYTN